MAAKILRRCPECFSRGITVLFETGNKMKQHRRIRHPKSVTQRIQERRALTKFRKAAILALQED